MSLDQMRREMHPKIPPLTQGDSSQHAGKPVRHMEGQSPVAVVVAPLVVTLSGFVHFYLAAAAAAAAHHRLTAYLQLLLLLLPRPLQQLLHAAPRLGHPARQEAAARMRGRPC